MSINTIVNIIYYNFVSVNPKPHLRPLKEHFSTFGHAFLKKGQFYKMFVNSWSNVDTNCV